MTRSSRRVIAGMYWLGALVDAFAAAALLTPAGSPLRALAYPGIVASEVAYADGTRTGFPLMLGWTLLLAWAAFRPYARRGVLLMTAVVVAGLVCVELVDVSLGYAALEATLPTFAVQAALIAGFVFAWMAAGGTRDATVDPSAADT